MEFAKILCFEIYGRDVIALEVIEFLHLISNQNLVRGSAPRYPDGKRWVCSSSMLDRFRPSNQVHSMLQFLLHETFAIKCALCGREVAPEPCLGPYVI